MFLIGFSKVYNQFRCPVPMKSLQKLFELIFGCSCQPSQFACRNMVDKCPSQTSSQPSEAKMMLIWMQRWMQAWPTHRNSSTEACEAAKTRVRTEVFKVMNNILGVFMRQTANVARDALEI